MGHRAAPANRRVPGRGGPELTVRPDGRLLVAADRAVRLPSDGGPPARAKPGVEEARVHDLVQGDEIGALAFAPDGSRLAAGDQSGRVTLWDGTLEYRAGVLRNVFPSPLGETAEAVSALAVSPDGRTLAVGGDAGALQLWDIATQQPLGGPLTTPGDAIASLAFSQDSTTLHAAAPTRHSSGTASTPPRPSPGSAPAPARPTPHPPNGTHTCPTCRIARCAATEAGASQPAGRNVWSSRRRVQDRVGRHGSRGSGSADRGDRYLHHGHRLRTPRTRGEQARAP